MRHLMIPLVLVAAMGCREELDPNRQDMPLRGDDDIADEVPIADFSVSPSTLAAGEVIIASLVADQVDFDYDAIDEIILYGDGVVVCATQARSDEMLVSVGAADDAPAQDVDMIVLLSDGDSFYAEGAFEVFGQ
ncbi:MAG: hypothetical protein AAFV53_23885 [Myxococcota bacterium]